MVWTLFINKYFLTGSWAAITWNEVVQCVVNPGLWFLMTLFQISMIFAVLHLLSRLKEKWHIDVVMALVVLCVILALKQMSLGLYFIFYTIGVFVSKYSWLERLWQRPAIIALAAIAFFVLTVHWQIDGNVIDDVLKLIVAPCAFVMAYHFSKRGEHTYIGNKLAYIGKNSLAIYIIHWNFLLFLKEFQIDLVGFNQFWLFLLALAVAVVISYVVIAIAKAIECNKYLAFLMLGKRL